jgi:hypothetical protein
LGPAFSLQYLERGWEEMLVSVGFEEMGGAGDALERFGLEQPIAEGFGLRLRLFPECLVQGTVIGKVGAVEGDQLD